MEQIVLKDFYDQLFEFFHDNCIKINHLKHPAGADVLVIAVGMKVQIQSLISYLNQGEEKPAHIYMVVQKHMIPVINDLEDEQCRFIEWQGPYTLDLISYLEDKVDLKAVRYLFYQGRQPMDLRDVNLCDILLEIKKKYENGHEVNLYMQDIRESVYLYKTPEKIRRGMDVYQAVDAYLEA